MKRVLVIDDDRVGATALASLLEFDGFEVVAETSAARGLAELKRAPLDVVITDLEMPGLHGLDLLREIHLHSPATPVLIVTGYSNSPASEAALAAGARRVFAKPVDYDELVAELARLLPA